MRPYDVVLLGASGFTGNFITGKLYTACKQHGYKLAIAGRNLNKLDQVKQSHGISELETVQVDIEKSESLVALASKTRLIVDAAGPFRFYGEPVVKACVETGCDYIDISGEPQFIELMELKYSSLAKTNNCLIISACGFDSVPADIGVAFLRKKVLDANLIPTSIESFLTISGGKNGVKAHYGTWESAVHGFSTSEELRKIRKEYAEKFPTKFPLYGRKFTLKNLFWSNDADSGSYSAVFPASDASIVKRSQRNNYLRNDKYIPTVYSAYFTLGKSYFNIFMISVFGLMFQTLASFSFGRWLLLKYPSFFSNGVFSKQGPSPSDMAQTKWKMEFVCKAYAGANAEIVLANPQFSRSQGEGEKQIPPPDRKVKLRVSGTEPGYVDTSSIVTTIAINMLKKKSTLPTGVLTTASAFEDPTDIVTMLESYGVKFDLNL